jgi:hypothetical protein
MLLVLGPIVAIVLLLRLARNRAAQHAAHANDESEPDAD